MSVSAGAPSAVAVSKAFVTVPALVPKAVVYLYTFLRKSPSKAVAIKLGTNQISSCL